MRFKSDIIGRFATALKLTPEKGSEEGFFHTIPFRSHNVKRWFAVLDYGAADGFNLMPPVLPSMLDIFVAEVIPLLPKRGLFRTGYEGDTLRQQFGLGRPAVTF